VTTLGFFDGDGQVAALPSNSTLVGVVLILVAIALAVWIVKAIR
jgi:hypothetical protein